tara:strand:+ start:1356 stop:4838 length:3483 start_codon:yes stop_codon:yes gene_type:complete
MEKELALKKIKILLENDPLPDKPKRIKKPNGEYTKKFLKWNKKKVREGKTLFYVDDKIYYDPKNNTFKLKRNAKKLDLNLSVNLHGYFEKKTVNTYKNNVITLLKTLDTDEKVSISINLNKINFKELITIIRQYLPNRKLVSTTVNSNNIVAFSDRTLSELSKINELTYQEKGSDAVYLYNTVKSGGIITISNLGPFDGLNSDSNWGLFFKWYNLTHYDLNHLDIRKEGFVDYSENCLLIALKNAGLSPNKCNKFKSITTNGIIPTCKLSKISIALDICIDVRKILIGKTCSSKQMIYGDKTKDKYKLGLIDNHYFAYLKSTNTRFSLEHYDEIKHINNCNEISAFRPNGTYKKDKKAFINTFDLVKILLEQKDKLLKPIPYDIMTCTPYFDKEMNSDELFEPDNTDLKINKMVKTDNSKSYLVFFDCETITKGDKHEAYLLCVITEDNIKKSFKGKDCGKYFIEWLKRLGNRKIQLVAHNLKYDFSFIWEYIFGLNPLISGNRLLGGGGILYSEKYGKIELVFQDSYNMISCKLSKFGSMFNLKNRKEFMPYSAYNLTSVTELTKLDTIYKCKEFKTQEDKDLFYNNCIEWKCIIIKNDKEYIDLVEYSKRYCEIDCILLKQGYESFKEQIMKVCKLNIKNYCTSASIAHDFMILQGVYEGSYSISGIVRAFIQKCVYGGKVMTRRNEKFIIEKETADYDCTSEYPSAMVEMKGVLMGKPKLLQKEHLNKEFLDSVDGYFVKVLCKNNSKKILDFPMLSYLDENGIRQYSNDTKDKFYYLDKTMLEDAINFLGLDFEYNCGYYYNEGRNPQIRKTIRQLFNKRLLHKNKLVLVDNEEFTFTVKEILDGTRNRFIKECEDENKNVKCIKNNLENVYKLLMNSAYGKSLLKPIDTQGKILKNDKIDSYVCKNYNFVKSIIKLNSKVSQLKTINPINEHFNNCYFGVEVLSMAKRIMSRVMITAEDMKIPMYYTDTDSIHIDYDGVEKLEFEYKKRFGKVLKGKNLGQFHIDFELKGAESNTIKSKKSIYLGKKCYLDILEGYDKKGNKITGQHVRMKGIPNTCLEYYSNKLYNGSMFDMYSNLYNNKAIKFDLLCEDNSIKFAYDGFDVKSLGYYKKDREGNKIMCEYDETQECNSEFARTISFDKNPTFRGVSFYSKEIC